MTQIKDLLKDMATEVAGIMNPPENQEFPTMPSKEKMINDVVDEYSIQIKELLERIVG